MPVFEPQKAAASFCERFHMNSTVHFPIYQACTTYKNRKDRGREKNKRTKRMQPFWMARTHGSALRFLTSLKLVLQKVAYVRRRKTTTTRGTTSPSSDLRARSSKRGQKRRSLSNSPARPTTQKKSGHWSEKEKK